MERIVIGGRTDLVTASAGGGGLHLKCRRATREISCAVWQLVQTGAFGRRPRAVGRECRKKRLIGPPWQVRRWPGCWRNWCSLLGSLLLRMPCDPWQLEQVAATSSPSLDQGEAMDRVDIVGINFRQAGFLRDLRIRRGRLRRCAAGCRRRSTTAGPSRGAMEWESRDKLRQQGPPRRHARFCRAWRRRPEWQEEQSTGATLSGWGKDEDIRVAAGAGGTGSARCH